MALPLTLLIGYYHGVLLRDINTDSLFDDMFSNCLLNVNDQSLISAGHSVHHRNWLLLEHIRHMDAKAFIVFCELVQNIWPLIGSQLITGMYECICVICNCMVCYLIIYMYLSIMDQVMVHTYIINLFGFINTML